MKNKYITIQWMLILSIVSIMTVSCNSENDVAPTTQAQELLPLTAAVKDRADNLYGLAKENYFVNLENAHFYANELLTLSTNSDYTQGMANAHQALGIVQQLKKNYQLAIQHYLSSASLNEMTGNEQNLSKVYNNLASIYDYNYAYDRAVYYYTKAIALKEEIGEPLKKIASSVFNLATTYSKMDETKLSIEQYLIALEYCDIDGNTKLKSSVLNNLGYAYAVTGQYDEAEAALKESLEIRTAAGNQFNVSLTHLGMGDMYMKKEDYQKAVEHFQIAKSLRDGKTNTGGYGRLLVRLGDAYANLGDYKAAINYLSNAESILVRENNYEQLAAAYGLKAISYRLMGEITEHTYYNSLANEATAEQEIQSARVLKQGLESVALAEANFEEFKSEMLYSSVMRSFDIRSLLLLALAFLLVSAVFGYSVMVLWRVQ